MTSLNVDIASDLPKGTALLSELSTSATKVYNTLKSLSAKIKEENLKTEKGLTLLELKNQLFLSYLGNLSYTTLLKLSGLRLEGNCSIEHLVELRVVLERIRPLEDKIKHQIEKYIKVGSTGAVEETDPSNIKNSLDNIEDSASDDEEVATTTSSKENKPYRIAKISEIHYPGEKKEDGRQKRERARALSMLKDSLQEHTDDPEVIHNTDTLKQKSIEKRKQIERYEEDNFTRLTLSKKQKAALKQIATPGTFGEDLLAFRSLEGLDRDGAVSVGGKKRKSVYSKTKKGKGFKKRKKH